MNIDFREAGRQAQAFGLAIGVHLLAALFVVLSTIDWVPFRKDEPVGLLIEAVIVDTSALQEQREAARQAAEREEQRQERSRELEQQRQREEERQRELEEQRRQQQIEDQRKKEAQDRLDQLRRERERKQEEERLQQQRELEQLRAEREAAERDRKIAEERLKQLEAQRQREAEQQRLAAEKEEQRQAAEQQQAFEAGRLATKSDAYEAAIRQVVTQNWLRPPTAQAGLQCRVDVVQIPGGEVISVNVRNPCNADPVTRRSIIAAVERAGNLPYRGFEDVFERQISFRFIYEGE